jgi:hypothetical protein
MSPETGREERIARNELAFRAANESLKTIFEDADEAHDEAYPFLCECGDRHCTEVVLLPMDIYESTRAQPTWFVIRPGHRQLESELRVDEGDGYEIIEKTGVAGEVVRANLPAHDLNPSTHG